MWCSFHRFAPQIIMGCFFDLYYCRGCRSSNTLACSPDEPIKHERSQFFTNSTTFYTSAVSHPVSFRVFIPFFNCEKTIFHLYRNIYMKRVYFISPVMRKAMTHPRSSTRPTLLQFWSFKVRSMTFLNHTKFVDILISRL